MSNTRAGNHKGQSSHRPAFAGPVSGRPKDRDVHGNFGRGLRGTVQFAVADPVDVVVSDPGLTSSAVGRDWSVHVGAVHPRHGGLAE